MEEGIVGVYTMGSLMIPFTDAILYGHTLVDRNCQYVSMFRWRGDFINRIYEQPDQRIFSGFS